MKHILIIEDEKNLARFISLELQHEGYDVTVAHDGKSGLNLALTHDYQLIILDVMLPEMDGFDVLEQIRSEERLSHIIMMTARDATEDVVAGLDGGADDYLVKPFAIEELMARVRSVFRRHEKELEVNSKKQDAIIRDLSLDAQNRSAIRGGQLIPLTQREFDLLEVLLTNLNRVMSREELLAQVWDYDEAVETNVVDVYIRYIRSKIDVKGKESYIQTVRGRGYVIRDK